LWCLFSGALYNQWKCKNVPLYLKWCLIKTFFKKVSSFQFCKLDVGRYSKTILQSDPRGEILYACHISAKRISAPKLTVVVNKTVSFSINCKVFLELRCMLIRYNKHIKGDLNWWYLNLKMIFCVCVKTYLKITPIRQTKH
jgi:hypothetical protein